MFGIARCNGEVAQRPKWQPGVPESIMLGEILHGILGGQVGQLRGLKNVQGNYLSDVEVNPGVSIPSMSDHGEGFVVHPNPDVATRFSRLPCLQNFVNQNANFLGVWDGALTVAYLPNGLFTSNPLRFGFPSELDGDCTELTVSLIPGILLVEEGLGTLP
jgi:hypothetical protein